MKICAFVASSSHRGNTATAVQALLDSAKESGAETEIFYLNEYHIRPCVGCRVCEKTDKCVIKNDDVEVLHEAIRNADAYVLGTPTYYGDITGQFKMFVDRVYPFIDIQKDPVNKTLKFGSIIKTRKPGVLVAVSGGHGESVFTSHKKVAYNCLNDINGYLWKDVLLPYTTWTPVAENPEQLAQLSACGTDLVEHFNSGEGEDVQRTQSLRASFSV